MNYARAGFIVLRRRPNTQLQGEKAQLHSDDLKPDRKELVGEGAVKRKPVSVAEMPANEDPKRITSELPENEIIGSEMDSQSKSASKAAGTGSM